MLLNYKLLYYQSDYNICYSFYSKMLWSQPLVFYLLMVSVHSSVELDDELKQLNLGIPELFNWETKGCTPGILDQGNCNAGYAYATAAAIGTTYCVYRKELLVFLSAKQIIRCSGDYGNNGCDGGSAVNAFKYVNSTDGLALALSYHIGATGYPCSITSSYKIEGFYHYEDVTEEFLIELLVSEGPLVVGIDASLQSFKDNKGDGIYNDTNCKSGLSDLNHDVLLVAYGIDPTTRTAFWEFVNSWGPLWGAGGRGRIERANNRCGIRTRVSLPVIPQ